MFGFLKSKKFEMKILHIANGDYMDYQNDCVLIGFKELYGSDVVDMNKHQHIYTTYCAASCKNLYGMGMSISRAVPDLEVDREDIDKKIENKYFDLVVFGSIWRCSNYLDKVISCYPSNNIIIIDGEDHHLIHDVFAKKLKYFKRELIYHHDNLNPISFALPTAKITHNKCNKSRDYAICDPRDIKTYIYKTESEYYNGYQESRFGITMKKAGWDCMRHYEIMGNGCLPYFLDIEKCPSTVLTRFPKEKCIEVKKRLDNKESPDAVYEDNWEYFNAHIRENNSTSALAQYLMDSLKS